MVSAFTHAYVALALRAGCPSDPHGKRLTITGMLCAALPDLDAIGHWSGVPYEHVCGHRGITHGLPFALVLALAVATLAVHDARIGSRLYWLRASYLFLATGSHGLLDMLTNGGLGIALFAPFLETRFFFPWRPIEVAPISISGFFTSWGLEVFLSEVVWVWLPTTLLLLLAIEIRRGRAARASASSSR